MKPASGWLLKTTPADAARYLRSGEWPGRTLSQNFAILEASAPSRAAITQGDVTMTRAQLGTQARRLASAFARLALRPGDVVSFILPNWPEVAILDLAASMTGIVVNPIVPIYRSGEARFILNDCRARVLFLPDSFRGFDYVNMALEIRKDLPNLEHLVVLRTKKLHEGLVTFESLMDNREIDLADLPKPKPEAVKIVLYTSGTTGVPKGVLHTHNTIGAEIRNVVSHWALTQADTVFMPSPLTHITGYLYGIQLPLTVGMSVAYLDQWNAAEAFKLLEQNECAFTVAATPFLQQLTELAETQGRSLPSLRYFACGGAPVAPELIYSAKRAFPNCIPCRVYGSTEAPTITLGPTTRESDVGALTDGMIVGHTVKLVEAGRSVVVGEEGEVLTRGPEVFVGYTDPVANAECFDEAGYFRTGDLARMDQSGCLTITGRVKDLIIRGGENISAKEVEDILQGHSAVHEVAVVAMPHVQLGETCCAFIVLRPGCDISLTEVAELIAASGVAKQKTPERIEVVEELPRTASGKIRKGELRERIKEIIRRESKQLEG